MGRSRSVSRGRRSQRSQGSTLVASRSRSRVSKAYRQDGITRRGYNWPQSYSGWFDPFPRTMRAILRYSTQINMDAGTGIAATHYFRGGSIFDPDFATGGHQPYGHDTYQSLYNHYRVIKAICKITSASNGGNNVMGLSLTDDTALSAGTTHESLREVKPTKFINLCSSTESHGLAMTYDSERCFPGGKQNTIALFGNSPAEEMYFLVWTQGNLPGNNPTALAVTVCIEYYCEFSELKDLGES